MKELKLHVVGTKPLITHNERLANPLNPYTRRLREITKKRQKTDDDLQEIMFLEARAGAYETPDNELGIPLRNLWASIYSASKQYKLGTTVKRALMFDDDVLPLLVDGKTVDADDFCSEIDNIDYRSVVVSRSRTMRARPFIKTWEFDAVMRLDTEELDPQRLRPVFERAGKMEGLCEMRPSYGTYELSVK